MLVAAFSYMYWYVGALLSAGASGALLLSGHFSLNGVNAGWALFIAALIGAVVFIFAAMVLNLLIYVVLINTAIVGACRVIGGLMLVLNRVDREDFDWGIPRAATNDSWLWWIVLIVLIFVGISSQMAMVSRVRLPDDRWSEAQPV